MKLRFIVTTPHGEAEKAEKNLRRWLLGMKKPTETGFKDDRFYWEVETDVKGYIALQKRAYLFSSMAGSVVKNKVFRSAASRMGATPEQFKEVETMLVDGTHIEIVKQATAEEVVEGTTTFWEKLKRGFRRDSG